MANISFPGTVVLWRVFNFSGLIQGEYNYNLLGQLVSLLESLFLWLFNRIAFGNLKTQYISKF
jgi:hypothetical protein